MCFQFWQKSITNVFLGVGIMYLNIMIYVCLLFLLFCLLFLFDLKKIKSLNNFKFFSRQVFLSTTTTLLFLSISGIPPLGGFAGKFLLLNFIYFLQKYMLILMFSIFNFFSIYFYTQNIRFLVSKYFLNIFITDGFYYNLNKKLINALVILNFLNFFLILYLKDTFYTIVNMFFIVIILSTIQQKYKNFLLIKKKNPILGEQPQIKGVVIKVRITTPRKPNSARRPVAKVLLSNKKQRVAHIPGKGHNLRKHSEVLISGVGARDLPGVHFSCIRGVYDLSPVVGKIRRRSIYGVKKQDVVKKKLRRKFRVL